MNARKRVIFIGTLYQIGTLTFVSLALLFLVMNMNHAKASAKWPSVEGVVTSGRNSQQVFDQNKVGSTWYQYEVAGKTYRCDRVSFFEPDEIYGRHEGEMVKVFYNPKDAQDACLTNGVTAVAQWRFYLYSFSFLWGIGMFSYMTYTLLFAKFDQRTRMTTAEKVAAVNIISGLGSL